MDTPRTQPRPGVSILILICIPFIISGCSSSNTSRSIFLPPTSGIMPTSGPVLVDVTHSPIPTILPLPTTSADNCTNNLLYIEDLTFPDGTVIKPGAEVDKQWQIENNGSCNWDFRYSLRQTSGDDLGIALEQALFPARAGSRIIIQINFTAPLSAGTYKGVWQAYDPGGRPFGNPLSILLDVVP